VDVLDSATCQPGLDDERRALQRLKRGDIEGLEFLVRAYQLQATRTAYLIVRDRALAQDIVQNAFVRVFERIAQFDSRRPFAPWFLKLVVNDARKAALRRQRESPLPDPTAGALVDRGISPERAWEQAETAAEIWVALGLLTPDQRAAIVQRYYLELSEHEMAVCTARPRSTVKARLHAARERLRTMLLAPSADLEVTP
jgi:RNA polymerase sigma-70 factor (ECF subfamily)